MLSLEYNERRGERKEMRSERELRKREVSALESFGNGFGFSSEQDGSHWRITNRGAT